MTPITRLTLPNGLLVLLKEIHTAPLISHWIWYRVGSRHEIPGFTGVSHWVEHMQFKGTPKFPASELDRAISRLGGFWNAFTTPDWSAFFETLPAVYIDLALSLEADRMLNSTFDPAEVETERTVIISERQGSENEPLFRLGEQVLAEAFKVHPYHYEVIGELGDLQRLQRDDLYRHYHSHYIPNNAVLTIAGDFNTPEMLSRITDLYGSLLPGELPAHQERIEPPQESERQAIVEGPGETTYIQFAYHIPPAVHADFLPLAVLDSLLCGPSDLSVFGGGLSNKTCRLYRALVEKEFAVSVYGGLQATVDPHLHTITALLHPDSSTESLAAALEGEIQRIQDTPPTPEDVARAVKQARALFAYNSESITNQAAWLGFAEMFANHAWLEDYLDRLAVVTPDDVQRAAQTYLRPQNCTLGIYLPTDGGEDAWSGDDAGSAEKTPNAN
jgi:zinc protease